ncbi:hypothetical protein PsorP6_012212 [Peronosclerospora sorghi]|uniref:Uncharacterized protein n=1 Tax=Peronosclerospora sorghi TaxID=230839 RepID=A0ACC0WI41_9STRA|nr:hypothetical protein PsorP6_012212 [Peronosclerospora sorghi]
MFKSVPVDASHFKVRETHHHVLILVSTISILIIFVSIPVQIIRSVILLERRVRLIYYCVAFTIINKADAKIAVASMPSLPSGKLDLDPMLWSTVPALLDENTPSSSS